MIAQMPTETAGMRLCHASDKLTEMEQLAEKLKANGAAEYRSYVQLSSAFYRGVSLTFWTEDLHSMIQMVRQLEDMLRGCRLGGFVGQHGVCHVNT